MESSSTSPDNLPSSLQQLLQFAISAIPFFRRHEPRALNAKTFVYSMWFMLLQWLLYLHACLLFVLPIQRSGFLQREWSFSFTQIQWGVSHMHMQSLVCMLMCSRKWDLPLLFCFVDSKICMPKYSCAIKITQHSVFSAVHRTWKYISHKNIDYIVPNNDSLTQMPK